MRIEKSLNEDRTFANVDEKGIRGPLSNELNERGRDTVFRKGSSASGSHGLSSDVVFEILTQSTDEKLMCGNGP